MARDPILNLQGRYFFKFPNIVSYQHKSFATRMCSNVQIVHTDGLPHSFK